MSPALPHQLPEVDDRALADWGSLAEFFDDMPDHKATDWAAGYLPAFAEDLGLSLRDCEANRRRTILDHGCGKGEPARFVADRLGADVCGVDVSAQMVRSAGARGDSRASFSQLRESTRLPFFSSSFDGAMSFFVFLTISNPGEQVAIARELHRVLAPGAPLVILVNNPDEIGRRFASFQSGEPGQQPRPGELLRLRLFELGSRDPFLDTWDVYWPVAHYEQVLRDAGFRQVRSERRCLDERYESAARALSIPVERLDVERRHAPFVAITGRK